jgi:hypothetical protein
VILYLDLLENMRGLHARRDGQSRKKEKGSKERDGGARSEAEGILHGHVGRGRDERAHPIVEAAR